MVQHLHTVHAFLMLHSDSYERCMCPILRLSVALGHSTVVMAVHYDYGYESCFATVQFSTLHCSDYSAADSAAVPMSSRFYLEIILLIMHSPRSTTSRLEAPAP